jgi:hypothetical protein
MIRLLAPGKVYVDHGPVQMTISAERHGKFLTREVEQAGSLVPEILKSLAVVLPLAKEPWPKIKGVDSLPKVLRLMTEAVSSTGERNLTPMAAVAGAFADLVADFLLSRKATKVIVNNGGDIAIRLKDKETAEVGIAPKVGAQTVTHRLTLKPEDKVGGVATSGLGGRSFTLGIADAVVVAAKSAVLADACATLVANYTNAEVSSIERCLAREIDPNTDIPDLMVTVKVGSLPKRAVQEAISRGLAKTIELVKAGLIYGSIVFVAGMFEMWPKGFAENIKESN